MQTFQFEAEDNTIINFFQIDGYHNDIDTRKISIVVRWNRKNIE